MENNFKAVISISKIDQELFKDSDDYKYHKKDDVYESILSYVKTISKSLDKERFITNHNGYDCIFYRTGSDSKWKGFIQSLFSDSTIPDTYFKTQFPSYLILKQIDGMVYCITAGRGNNLIENYKDKLFGISLVPKLVNKDDSVIKYISDYRVYGRRSSTKFANRGTSNFSFEQNLESIYNELSASFNHEIQKSLGLTPEVNQDGSESTREISVSFGANIHINKQVSIDELDSVIKRVHELSIDDSANNFVINFLVAANKVGFVQSDIAKEFINHVDSNPDIINFAYNHNLNNNLEEYELVNVNDNPISSNELMNLGITSIKSLEDLREYIVKSIKDNKSANSIIKGRYLKTNYEFEELKKEYVLFELLDQEFNYKGKQVYLMDGTWYVFIEQFMNFLNQSYLNIFNESKKYCKRIFNKENIDIDYKSFKNENELKEEISKNPNIIDADMIYIDGVEIADAIYLKDKEIILIHNKSSFDGPGMRDITGQISSSAQIISKIRNRNYTSSNKIDNYFDKLKEKNGTNYDSMISNLITLFNDNNTAIRYICGFVEPLKKNVKSNYIKYLLDTTKHKLEELQYDFYIH
jgi:uncharacterized protein (TIGR04141 family)